MANNQNLLLNNSDSDFESPPRREKLNVDKDSADVNMNRKSKRVKTSAVQTAMIPDNPFGPDALNKRDTKYRSNIMTAVMDLKKIAFSDREKELIRSTPFGFFFDAIMNTNAQGFRNSPYMKSEDEMFKMMMCFDQNSSRFFVGGKKLELQRVDIEAIFGVIDGGEAVIYTSTFTDCEWVKRVFCNEVDGNKTKAALSKQLILDLLKKHLEDRSNIEDIARLGITYMLAAMFTPTHNGSLSWHLTYYLEDFNGIKKYNWGSYIVDMLRDQLTTTKSSRVGGCAMLIPFWFCEHLRIIKPDKKEIFPRFLKWDLRKLYDEIKKSNSTPLNYFKFKSVHIEELELLESERQIITTRFEPMQHNHDEHNVGGSNEACVNVTPKGMLLIEPPSFSLGISLSDDSTNAATDEQGNKSLHDIIRQKDDEINRLKDEISKLKNKRSSEEDLIETQMWSDPTNLQIIDQAVQIEVLTKNNMDLITKNFTLLEERRQLIERLNSTSNIHHEEQTAINDDNDQHPDQPYDEDVVCLEKKGKTPSTLVKRVKMRTENEERVATMITPDVGRRRRGKKTSDSNNLAINKNSLAAKLCSEEIRSKIQNWNIREGVQCFMGEGPMSIVTAIDLCGILNHQEISSNIIDAWAEKLLKIHGVANGTQKMPVIFSTVCLNYIENYKGKKSKNLKSVIDNVIQANLEAKVFVFPLLSLPNHWTLLKLDVDKCIWSFYNSLAPRRINSVDKNMRKVDIVVKYLGSHLKLALNPSMPTHPCVRAAIIPVIKEDCLQQKENSVDCGVVVCMNMEHIVRNESVETGGLTNKMAAEYRAKMVSCFLSEV